MHQSRPRAELLSALLTVVALVAAPSFAWSQQRAQLLPELRADAIDVRSSRSGTLHAGVGLNLPLGYYVRLETVGAGGVTRIDSSVVGSARADLVARFLLDPFGESRWGPSFGGGISARWAKTTGWHEYVVLVLDLEAPPVRGVVPAFQLGLGGGARLGLALRRHQTGRR
jgi:hypothetical protein